MTVVKNLSTSPKDIEKPKFHEPRPQEDPKPLCNHPFQLIEETKESWTTFNGEQPLDPDIEEFLQYLSSNPLFVQRANQKIVEYLNGMEEECI